MTGSLAQCVSSLSVTRLETVFAQCFSQSDNACLSGGFAEPLYAPATTVGQLHVLRYREDFFASALHEVSHWCIAGPARRLQTDFGYWYAPDGRSVAQQIAFENVEYKPQALEWFFAKACGHPFRISVDNLDGEVTPDSSFSQRVLKQARLWSRTGLPDSGGIFFRALCKEFGAEDDIGALRFSLCELQ